ncbi:peptidylprolyl isomerase [soil metagenome]
MNPRVTIATDEETIVVEVDDELSPVTSSNFLSFIDEGAYDGGRFYRTVTPDNQPNDSIRIAVIQGGVAEGFSIEGRSSLALERTSVTGLRHRDGTISMARSEPDSAMTEFFICVGDQPELDFGGQRNPDGNGFAAFGQVVAGMDVVRSINESPCVGQQLTPTVPIVSIRRQ